MTVNDSTDPSAGPAPPSDRQATPRFLQSASLEQSFGAYLPATVAFRLINFGRILLLIRFMTKEQFGLLSMVLLMGNVLTPLCSLGLNEAVVRYVPQYEQRGSLQDFFRRSFGLILMVAIGALFALVVLSPFLGELFYGQPLSAGDAATQPDHASDEAQAGEAWALVVLSSFVIALLIVYFYFLAVLKGLRMFAALSWMELSHGILFLFGGGLAIGVGRTSARELTILYAASLVLPIVLFSPRLWRAIRARTGQNRPLEESSLTRKLLAFGLWTAVAALTWQLLLFCPQWFLNMVHGPDAVAIFNAIRQIGQFILLAGVAVSTVVMTTVTKTWEAEGRDKAQQQLSLAFRTTGLGLFVLCAVLALGKDVIILMFRSDYAPGADILPLQLLFFLFGGFLSFLPAQFHLREKTRYMIWPWSLGVLANVAFYWIAEMSSSAAVQPVTPQIAHPVVNLMLTTGFDTLGVASWCGAAAMGVATGVCMFLVHRRCERLDRGTLVVIAAALLLAARWWILLGGTVILLALAMRTALVFTAEERRKVFRHVAASIRSAPLLNRGGGGDSSPRCK